MPQTTVDQALDRTLLDAPSIERPPTSVEIRMPQAVDTMPKSDRDLVAKNRPARFGIPVFELASFAIPTRWKNVRESDRAAAESHLHAELNIALRTFVHQLPVGAALMVEHRCAPTGDGAMEIQSRLVLELPDSLSHNGSTESALRHELKVCLSALSDHYSFRPASSDDSVSPSTSDETVQMLPVFVAHFPMPGNIGFARTGDDKGTVLLPAIENMADDTHSLLGAHWPGTLLHTFKAARALGHGVWFRIRLTRERLDIAARAAMVQLLKSDMSAMDAKNVVGNDGKSLRTDSAGSNLRGLVLAWTQADVELYRVEVEAQSVGAPVSHSLLRILASEVFPGQTVEVISGSSKRRAADFPQVFDFSNVYPLTAGLPPLMPQPAVLETLGFARHYSNPSVKLPSEGLLLGRAQLNGFEHPVRISADDRARHVYMLGATGTGKSTLIYNMIVRDMKAGEGVALVDPHGDLFDQVLAAVPAGRVKDVVIIDPSDALHPVGLNPFDFDGKPSLSKANRTINDLLDVFEDLYNMKEAGGPGFEQYFRNSCLLASTASSATLLTPLEVLRDKAFREKLLKNCHNSFLGADVAGEVGHFFNSAHATSGEQRWENWVPYITSKLSRFTNNSQLRKMLCAPKRTVDFRKLIDERRILLVNLSKGDIGSQDTRMIGMLISKHLFQAAMARADIPRDGRVPFYYYIDEFHNFVTSDIPEMLAETRKFALHLILAHQTLGQLLVRDSRKILDAVLGNVGTKLLFRVGMEAAQALESGCLPQFDAQTLAQLPDRHVLARLMVDRRPSQPFVFQTNRPDFPARTQDGLDMAAKARSWSRKRYTVRSPAPASIQSADADEKRESTLILHGRLAISHSRNVVHEDAIAIDAQIRDSIPRWKEAANATHSLRVASEPGCFYWTQDRSLVLVLLIDSERDRRVLIVANGHANARAPGNDPGLLYWVRENGRYRTESPAAPLLGMNLREKADIKFALPDPMTFTPDGTFAWLWQTTENSPLTLSKQPTGFFRTLNGSLVFVTRYRSRRSLRAVVCSGGHAIEKVDGSKPSEHYELTSDGQFLVHVENMAEVSTASLALASGMSLAAAVQLVGEDSPQLSEINHGQAALP